MLCPTPQCGLEFPRWKQEVQRQGRSGHCPRHLVKWGALTELVTTAVSGAERKGHRPRDGCGREAPDLTPACTAVGRRQDSFSFNICGSGGPGGVGIRKHHWVFMGVEMKGKDAQVSNSSCHLVCCGQTILVYKETILFLGPGLHGALHLSRPPETFCGSSVNTERQGCALYWCRHGMHL